MEHLTQCDTHTIIGALGGFGGKFIEAAFYQPIREQELKSIKVSVCPGASPNTDSVPTSNRAYRLSACRTGQLRPGEQLELINRNIYKIC